MQVQMAEEPVVEEDVARVKRPGRRKVDIEFIQDRSRRHSMFCKRKAGIFKKVALAPWIH